MQTVGIDIGGTFTDLVTIDENGSVSISKVPSTPDDFARGVTDVIDVLRDDTEGDAKASFRDITSFTLGTTIATNAMITRSGGTIGLLTTVGHGDLLSLMRVFGRVAGLSSQHIQSYALTDKPRPIVPRTLVEEVTERVDCFGDVVVGLDEGETLAAIERLIENGVDGLAVSFLWSFLNSDHERRVRTIANDRFPELPVVLASDVVPKIGEYERTVTTVVNAYLTPVLGEHLDHIGDALRRRGLDTPLLIMHSTGGVGTEGFTRENAARTLASGPAGGVIGAQRLGEMIGHENIVCTDVGGTSFDVGLVAGGRPVTTPTTTIDQYVMYLPSIDIVSIGMGGGSIVRAADGSIAVGPESAGADPGPACYGQGGTLPTLTDADVLLGYIAPDRFLGGKIGLDRSLAEEAFRAHVAGPLKTSVPDAAAAVFAISNAKMADLIRKATVERGLDPRDFVLYAYGGLGPLHAPYYGIDLGVKSVVVPLGEISSVFSAYGIATSDIQHIFEASDPMNEPYDVARINANVSRLDELAHAQLETDGVGAEARHLRYFIEMRYKGQLFELSVPLPSNHLDSSAVDQISAAFQRTYVDTYGPASLLSGGKTEIIAFRVEAIGRRKRPQHAKASSRSGAPAVLVEHRDVYWPEYGSYRSSPVFDGHSLSPGTPLVGPAVLDLATSTALVPPDWVCEADDLGNLVLNSGGGRIATTQGERRQ